MHFINPIPFVRDMDRARAFYRDVMQLKIRTDMRSSLASRSRCDPAPVWPGAYRRLAWRSAHMP